MGTAQNFTPLWRINFLLLFSVVSCSSASGLGSTPVYDQKVQNSSFQFSQNKNESISFQWQKNLFDLVRSVTPSDKIKAVNSKGHHNNINDNSSDSVLMFGTTNSFLTHNIRAKRDADGVSGTETSTGKQTSGSLLAVSVATAAETGSEMSEATSTLASTTEVRSSSQIPTTETTLASSPLTVTASAVPTTKPTNTNGPMTTETTKETYTTTDTTTVLPVCPEISELNISEATAGKIEIAWSLIPDEATNFRNICLEVTSVGNDACENYSQCFSNKVTSETVSSLCHFNEYNVSVSLECDDRSWKKCTQNIKTETAAPTEPTNLRNGTVTNKTIALNWSPPDFPNGIITKYTIYWKTSSDPENSNTSQETSYIIRNLKPYTNYSVSVSASTSAGESENRTEPLTIETEQGIPTEPRNLENVTVTNTTVALKWSPPSAPNGKIMYYTVYWTSSDSRNSNKSYETTYLVEKLRPYTIYNISVSATTSVGESEERAGPLRIETQQGMPDPPAHIVLSNVLNTTLTVSWSAPSVVKGVITNYSVYWKILDTTDNYQSYVTNEKTMQLKDLNPFTNYTVKVSAWTAVGQGPASEEETVETKEGIPDPPEHIVLSNVLNTTLTVSWSAPSVVKGVITNYSVYWKILDTTDNYQSDVTNEKTMQLKDLNPFTNYTVKVSAWTAVGQGPVSEEETVETKEGIPGQPLNLLFEKGTNVSLVLRWSPPVRPNGKIRKYDVSWSFMEQDNFVKKIRNTNETSLYIGHLTPYVNYTLSVSAWTEAGKGSSSVEETYQTDVGEPSMPKNLSTSSVTSDSLILRWEKPENPRGPIDGYSINWATAEETLTFEDMTSGKMSTYTVKKLKPFTNYTFWVTAFNKNRKNEVLKSEISKTAKAQTAEGIPSSPTDFHVEAFTNTTLIVTWEKPETPNGNVLVYTIYWQSADGSTDLKYANTSSTRYVISELNSFTKYNLTVSATTIAGEGPIATERQGKTDVGMPSAPRNGTVSNVGDTWILVEWKMPEFQHGPIYSFFVCWKKCLLDDETNVTVPEICRMLRPAEGESCDDYNTVVTELRDDQNATAPVCQYHITTNIDPWTNYSIEIRASNKNQFQSILKGPAEVIQQQTAASVPEEPIFDDAYSVTSTAVFISWRYAGRCPGPLSYAIYLEADERDICTAHDQRNITEGLKNGTAKVAGLRPFTYYNFRVFASTPAGSSRSQKTTTVKTKPDVPAMPKNLRVNCSYSPTKAFVRWRTPEKENGLIEEYKIRYKQKNGVNNYEIIVKVDEPQLCMKRGHEVELRNLHPEKIYEISVMGKTRDVDSYGESASNSEQCRLPAGVPPYPSNNSLPDVKETSQEEATFTFSKTTFSTEMGAIKHYAIIVGFSHVIGKPTNGSMNEANNQKLPFWNQFWKQNSEIYQATPENWNPFEENEYDPLHCQRDPNSEGDFLYCTIGWVKNCSEEEQTYCNGPLKPGTRYGIKLRGFTAGGFSETSPIYISTASIETSSSAGIIVGLVVFFVLAILIAVAIVLDKRKNYKTINRIRNILMKKDPSPVGRNQDIEINDLNAVNNAARTQPMDFVSFLNHVKVMMSDSFLRFSLEYEEIKQTSPKHPCTAAEMEENRSKNRWMNIFPFDRSRVKLLPIDDEPSSDYINANYIPGFTSHREYIATQGPLPNTVDDFWRMVWEQGVTMIVMLTQCVERGKKKCEQYWPSDSDNVYYGDLKIQLKSESILSSYCIRIFDLQLGTKQHTVKQMHFTKWPDFGSPESPEDLINFVNAVRDHLPHTNTGPILVHCSAGVGRTGTFIAVDRLLQHIQHYNEINIYNTVVEMRHYRTNMVQTEDQYIYIHKCLRDIISQKLNPRASIYDDDDDDDLYSNIKPQQATEL